MNKFFARRTPPVPPTAAASAQDSSTAAAAEKQQQSDTVSMTLDQLKVQAIHLAIALAAVMATAALQAGLDYIHALHPTLFAGASQLAAAFAGIKLLGQQ